MNRELKDYINIHVWKLCKQFSQIYENFTKKTKTKIKQSSEDKAYNIDSEEGSHRDLR